MTDENIEANFTRIAQQIKANERWRKLLAGEYADEMKALDEIAKHYGGENWHTGGGVYVVVNRLGEHELMGVSPECVCFYRNSKSTEIEDIFYEPENDTGEGIVSLCG